MSYGEFSQLPEGLAYRIDDPRQYANSVGMAKDRSRLDAARDRTDQAIDCVTETVEKLAQRLGPVLSPAYTTEKEEAQEPKAAASPFTVQVKGWANRIDRLNRELQSLMDRLDL